MGGILITVCMYVCMYVGGLKQELRGHPIRRWDSDKREILEKEKEKSNGISFRSGPLCQGEWEFDKSENGIRDWIWERR